MSATITSQSVPTGLPNPNAGLQSFNAEQFTRASASRQQATNLSITTAQGDIITLSMNASQEITRTTYDRFGRTSNEQIQVRQDSLTVEDSREFSIQVQGDLNRQELKDLQKVIKRVDKIVRDLLKGDLDHAVKQALKLGNLKSFASLEANIEVRQSFSLEQQRIVELATPQVAPPAALQDPEELATPTQSNLNIPDEDEFEDSTKSLSSFIDQLRNEVNNSGVEKSKLLPRLNNAFSDIIRDLSEEHGSESPILAATELIRNELVDSLNDEHEHDTAD